MMGRPRKLDAQGRCGRCAQRKHCGECVCCTFAGDRNAPDAATFGARAIVTLRNGRKYAVVYRTNRGGYDYVNADATHRIPSLGRVALEWRDRITAGVAPVTRTNVYAYAGTNERVARVARERAMRARMQSRCRG